MNRTVLAIALCAGAAIPAAAQFTNDSTITMILDWSEATSTGTPVANPNGVLERGESAFLRLSVSFSNQFGVAHFFPPIGNFTSGTIMGIGSGWVDINGSGGTEGIFNNSTPQANGNGTSGFGVRGQFRIADNGTVTPTGIENLQFGQLPFGAPIGNTANPVPNMFRMLWTPASYAPRTAAFQLEGSTFAGTHVGAVLVQADDYFFYWAYLPAGYLHLGRVEIPIAPAPSGAVLLPFAALARPRRKPQP